MSCPACLVGAVKPTRRMMPDYRETPLRMVVDDGFECQSCGASYGYTVLSDEAIHRPGGPFGVTICDFCGSDHPSVTFEAEDSEDDGSPPQRVLGAWGACLTCAALVYQGDEAARDALVERALVGNEKRLTGLLLSNERRRVVIRQIHDTYFFNRRPPERRPESGGRDR